MLQNESNFYLLVNKWLVNINMQKIRLHSVLKRAIETTHTNYITLPLNITKTSNEVNFPLANQIKLGVTL